jgi:hypothetical protein
MTTRRLGAAAIIVASLMAGTACQGGDDDFEPDAEGYVELACSIGRHQRDMSAAEVTKDEVERQLAYVASTALLESGNRRKDTELQDLSDALKVAIDNDDAQAFDDARADLDGHCEDDDLSVDEPENLVDIACSIADVLEPGPGPEVLLTVELVGAAADEGGEYDDLFEAAGHLVINPDDPLGPDHPDEAAIKDVQDECP